MKKIVFSVSLFLAMVLLTFAGPSNYPWTKIVPHYVSGAMDGRFTFHYWGTGFWDFYTMGDVKGTLSQLGQVEIYTKHTPHEDGTLTNGEFTIVTASDDKIRGYYQGFAVTISDSQALGNAQLFICGGTGRFSHARGMLYASFIETFDDPTWASAGASWALAGIVDYPKD